MPPRNAFPTVSSRFLCWRCFLVASNRFLKHLRLHVKCEKIKQYRNYNLEPKFIEIIEFGAEKCLDLNTEAVKETNIGRHGNVLKL